MDRGGKLWVSRFSKITLRNKNVILFSFKLYLTYIFCLGNRWLRAQKSEETKVLENVTYPKKKEKMLFQYFRILECCHFFSTHSHKSSSSGQTITLLTTSTKSDKSDVRDQLDEGQTDEYGVLPPKDVADSHSKLYYFLQQLIFLTELKFLWICLL